MANERSITQQLDRLESRIAVAEMAVRALANGPKRDLTTEEERHTVDPRVISQSARANDRGANLGREWARHRNPHYQGR